MQKEYEVMNTQSVRQAAGRIRRRPTTARYLAVTSALVGLVGALHARSDTFGRGSQAHCAATTGSAVNDAATGSLLITGTALGGSTSDGVHRMRIGLLGCVGPSKPTQFPGDCNGNRQVDLKDYQCFLSCMNGPGVVSDESCVDFDFNTSESVGLEDLARFQRIFGAGVGG